MIDMLFIIMVKTMQDYPWVIGIQVLIQSIPRYKKLCYAGWLLIPYDFWFGFCWILAHLLANALTSRQTHRYHIIFIVIGIALPFTILNQVFFIQCLTYSLSLFILIMDLTRKHPFVGLICFVIPFLPFILGNQSYKPSEIFQQIEKTFKPSESVKHSLHPSQFLQSAHVLQHLQSLHLSQFSEQFDILLNN